MAQSVSRRQVVTVARALRAFRRVRARLCCSLLLFTLACATGVPLCTLAFPETENSSGRGSLTGSLAFTTSHYDLVEAFRLTADSGLLSADLACTSRVSDQRFSCTNLEPGYYLLAARADLAQEPWNLFYPNSEDARRAQIVVVSAGLSTEADFGQALTETGKVQIDLPASGHDLRLGLAASPCDVCRLEIPESVVTKNGDSLMLPRVPEGSYTLHLDWLQGALDMHAIYTITVSRRRLVRVEAADESRKSLHLTESSGSDIIPNELRLVPVTHDGQTTILHKTAPSSFLSTTVYSGTYIIENQVLSESHFRLAPRSTVEIPADGGSVSLYGSLATADAAVNLRVTSESLGTPFTLLILSDDGSFGITTVKSGSTLRVPVFSAEGQLVIAWPSRRLVPYRMPRFYRRILEEAAALCDRGRPCKADVDVPELSEIAITDW